MVDGSLYSAYDRTGKVHLDRKPNFHVIKMGGFVKCMHVNAGKYDENSKKKSVKIHFSKLTVLNFHS